MEIEEGTAALAYDAHSIPDFLARCSFEMMAKQRHFMSAGRESLEHFVKMHFRATSKRICDVLPVKYQDFQRFSSQ